MPVGENVTQEMCEKFKEFLKDSYADYVKNRCRATLRCLIISLYETAKVVYTFNNDINKGKPNYKYVKQSMPNSMYVVQLETLRDNLAHNYHKVKDVVVAVYDCLTLFDKDKTTHIAVTCGLPVSLYDDIIGFCTAYIRRTSGNTPVQGNTSGFMSGIINGINPNRR